MLIEKVGRQWNYFAKKKKTNVVLENVLMENKNLYP